VACRVVEFATYNEMRRAIDKLDNSELNGRRVRLIEDKSASKRRNKCFLLLCSSLEFVSSETLYIFAKLGLMFLWSAYSCDAFTSPHYFNTVVCASQRSFGL